MKKTKQDIKSKKHQLLIETAHDLFLRYGIKRVTVEEICDTAGVSKMTFYKHYKNKLDIALFILNKLFQEGIDRYQRIMDQDVPYSEKVKEIIKLKLESTGEISKEMFKDFFDSSIPEVAEFIQKTTHENVKRLLVDLITAQKKGEIRQDINPHFIIHMIGQMQEMAADEKLLNMYGSTQALASEFINFFYYGVLSRKEE
jgi:AcrR family transcriptional regulator